MYFPTVLSLKSTHMNPSESTSESTIAFPDWPIGIGGVLISKGMVESTLTRKRKRNVSDFLSIISNYN